jgi:hypothetical protein
MQQKADLIYAQFLVKEAFGQDIGGVVMWQLVRV